MPWDETNCMNERVRFIAAHLEAGEPFSALCEGFEVSRKTGYKWVERYETDGVAGLEERSRAPLSHPHAVADDVVEKILRARKKHPRWGPRKLRVILQRHYPQLVLPATSTIGTDAAAIYLPVRVFTVHCSSRHRRYSNRYFENTVCRTRFEPTTVRRSRLLRQEDCPDLRFGGFVSESVLSGFSPADPIKTEDMNGCTPP